MPRVRQYSSMHRTASTVSGQSFIPMFIAVKIRPSARPALR